MAQKIRFSIEDARVINENPKSNFAILSLDFFASGENLHDMYVSEETLMRTANTIKNCPLVWKYDKELDDVYTHDKDEVPCGFVPETSTIMSKKLEDGRTMLSVVAYVWKRYTGQLLNIFRRDNGKKPVSVEMSLFDSRVLPDGLMELLDFRYEGITILGSYVTPAIPLASANVLSFAKLAEEYNDALKEFSFSDAEAERIKKEEENKLETFDEETLLTFPYKSLNEINPALKGISPPITLGQANAIAAQADAVGTDEKKNGWAIAISSFKKTHTVKDGRWVKKEGSTVKASAAEEDNPTKEEEFMKTKEELEAMSAEERAAEEAKIAEEEKAKEVEMAADSGKEEESTEADMAKPEEEETPADEQKETPAEQNKEEKEGSEKKFEFPKNFDMAVVSGWFADDNDEDDIKMAKEEAAKGEFANPAVLMGGLYAKMCKMFEAVTQMAEDKKVYMTENEELKKFKASVEQSQKDFAVEQILNELSKKVVIPDEARKEMIADAANYTLANIEDWKTSCKAKSFDFALTELGKEDVVKVGFPFTKTASKKKDELWS